MSRREAPATVTVRCDVPLEIELAGEFDLTTVNLLEVAINGATADADVILWTAGVTFASAALLHSLTRLAARAAGWGKTVELRQPSAAMIRLLQITETSDLFRIVG
jgi:anti-anti-sigma regulatory factor